MDSFLRDAIKAVKLSESEDLGGHKVIAGLVNGHAIELQ